jgi:1-acyl-sn-glycerol-3-phosphate acyltransferase
VRTGDLNAWWRLGIPLVAPFVRLLFRVRVEGVEHVPLSGSAILAFNHVSVLDGPVLVVETSRRIRRATRFLVAAEIFAHPVWGPVLRGCEQIPIRRGEQDTGALVDAVDTVRHGALAAIAPEGRIDDRGGETGLQRLRSGIARIALPTGAPVIPVGIWGTQTRWPRSGLRWGMPLRPRLALAFGAPLLPSGDPDVPHDVDDLLERLRVRLEQQVARARAMTAGQP